MKKIILLTFCALIGAAAWGQRNFYAESYTERSGRLCSKMWMSNGFARGEPVDDKTGKKMFYIFRPDSAKVYVLFPDEKQYMALPKGEKNVINEILGAELEKDRKYTRKYVRDEVVEGFSCKCYDWESQTVLADGSTEKVSGTDWIYEPLNLIIKATNNMTLNGMEYIVVKKIQRGVQPAHLFEIPKDYKSKATPAVGSLLEKMMKMKMNSKKVQDAKSQEKDKSKNQGEQNKDMLNILNGMLNEKKK